MVCQGLVPPGPRELARITAETFLTPEHRERLLKAEAQSDALAACRGSDVAGLEAQLVKHESLMSFIDEDCRTLLHWGSPCGHAAVVRMLITIFASKDQRSIAPLLHDLDAGGCSSLHYASQEVHLKVVVTLLYHGASVDLLDRQRKSPLVEAIEGGHVAVGRFLLARSAVLVVEAGDGGGAVLAVNGFRIAGASASRGEWVGV